MPVARRLGREFLIRSRYCFRKYPLRECSRPSVHYYSVMSGWPVIRQVARDVGRPDRLNECIAPDGNK
jgi:hypothetical protein